MKDTEYPTTSPWGEVQSATKFADGIYMLETECHGGFYLTPERNSEVPNTLKENTFLRKGFDGFYEEDCDAELIFTHFNLLPDMY